MPEEDIRITDSLRADTNREFTYPDRFQATDPDGVVTIVRDYFRDKDREEFLVMLADTTTVIGVSRISIGALSSPIVEARQIFKTAILANAVPIILAYQHPSGRFQPGTVTMDTEDGDGADKI